MLNFFKKKKRIRQPSSTTRAALLPTPGDPFLVNLWLKSFENIWSWEVDKLYVHINSYLDPTIVETLKKRLSQNPKISVLVDDRMVDHGNSLTRLVQESKEDLLMLIEDDAFIFKPGAVDRCFSLIEAGTYDCLGSPRGSCSLKIFDLGMEKFKDATIGFDTGPNFWPNFFFCRRRDLLKTDLNLGAFEFSLGQAIPSLGYVVDETSMRGDTFVWASLQLRGLGLKCGYVEQYKMHPNDFHECKTRTNCFSRKAPWFHSGNLSGSLHSWLRNSQGYPIGGHKAAAPVDMSEMPEEAKGHGATDEFERRAIFLQIAHEASKNDFEEISDFKATYHEAIKFLIKRFGLCERNMKRRKKMYQKLLKPIFQPA